MDKLNISHGGNKMKAVLEKIKLTDDTSALFKKFIEKVHIEKGKHYQIRLNSGEGLTIFIVPQGMDDREDDEDSIVEDISRLISKDEAVINEPDLYDPNYGRDSL